MKMKAQTKWGWDHAIYLFLGGLGAATYVIGALAGYAGEAWLGISKVGIISGVIILAIGYVVLLVGLGRPMNAIHAMKCPGTSWISRGVIIVLLFVIFAGIHWLLTVFNAGGGLLPILGFIGIVMGFGVMLYTGFLLAANRPIAFWANPLLPIVFLASALYSGLLATLLLSSIFVPDAVEQMKFLAVHSTGLAVFLILAMALYIWGTHRTPEGRAAAEMLMSGQFSGMFWVGVFLMGLFVPLVLELINLYGMGGTAIGMHILAGILGLIGMLLLRQVILGCGVMARLQAARFEYVLPHI